MARIEFAPEVAKDIDRIVDHLLVHNVDGVTSRIGAIIQAIDILNQNPLIGRPTLDGKRELIIGRRSHGYIALYRYVAEFEIVFILGLRSQTEAGYRNP